MSKTDRRSEVSENQLLEAVHSGEKPFVTAAGLDDELPITRQAIGRRLRQLAERGVLNREQVGGRAVVYWPKNSSNT